MERTIFTFTEASEALLAGKTFYVIELFPYPQFLMGEDGLNKEFDTYEEAQNEASDCQEGIVAAF